VTDLDQLAPAWVKALNDLKDITRDQTANAGTYSYKFATLDAVSKQAREVLGPNGLAVQQFAHSDGLGSVCITTTVWHDSGQSISAPPLVFPAKGGPQDVGSSISYARRYALMAFLGLATDDDDGAGAQQASVNADKPHPLSERVAAVQKEMKRLTDTGKQEIRAWADGRKLSATSMLSDEAWLAHCENWLDEQAAPEVAG